MLITQADLAALTALNLRQYNGKPIADTAFNPTTPGQVATWLLSANATDMTYMLSAQLATMVLNIRHGLVDGASFDLCSHETINQLVSAANGALSIYPTVTTSAARTQQETLKTCLDKLNNGAPVVPATPCDFSFGP